MCTPNHFETGIWVSWMIQILRTNNIWQFPLLADPGAEKDIVTSSPNLSVLAQLDFCSVLFCSGSIILKFLWPSFNIGNLYGERRPQKIPAYNLPQLEFWSRTPGRACFAVGFGIGNHLLRLGLNLWIIQRRHSLLELKPHSRFSQVRV